MKHLADLARQRVPPTVREEWRHRRGRYQPWEDDFDFTPPEPAAGEVPGPPAYVGIGVRGAESGHLARRLVQHRTVRGLPGGFLGLGFFAPYAAESFGDEDIRRYSGWFARPPGTVVGEWTNEYLTQCWVPPLLARAAPGTLLLVVLRDPVERYRAELSNVPPVRSLNIGQYDASALQCGLYGEHLARWIRHFPRTQLHVIQYETLAAEPAQVFSAACGFLGLERPQVAGPSMPVRSLEPLPSAVRDRLVEFYRPDVAALARLAPELDLSRWPNFG